MTHFEHAEGEYAAMLVEPRVGRIHFVNDRFGARPLYVLRDGHRTFVSTHLPFLRHCARRSLRFDPLGIFQVLQFEHTLGRQTIFRDLERVPPVSQNGPIAARLTGPMTALNHPVGTIASLRHMLAHERFLVGGGPGDVLAGSRVRSLLDTNPGWASSRIRQFVDSNVRLSPTQLRRLFREDAVAAFDSATRASLLTSLDEVEGPTSAHRITNWTMSVWQSAFTFNCAITAHPSVSQASPHLGVKYSELMLKLPATWLYRRNFYEFMVWKALPQLRDVIYANTGQLVRSHLVEYLVPTRVPTQEALRPLVRRVLRSNTAAPLLARIRRLPGVKGRGSLAAFNLMARDKELLATIETSLTHPHLAELIDARRAREFMSDVRTGRLFSLTNTDHGQMLGVLASLCYSTRFFLA